MGECPARYRLALGLGRTSVGPAKVPPPRLVSIFCVSKLRLLRAVPDLPAGPQTGRRSQGHLGAQESQLPAGLDPAWCLLGREGQGGGQGEEAE